MDILNSATYNKTKVEINLRIQNLFHSTLQIKETLIHLVNKIDQKLGSL